MKYMVRLNKRTGTIEFLGEPLPGLALNLAVRSRFSEIVPVPYPLWLAFRVLRYLFGEHGRVADWTRTWRCSWICVIMQGPHYGKHAIAEDRSALVKWEQAIWVSQRLP